MIRRLVARAAFVAVLALVAFSSAVVAQEPRTPRGPEALPAAAPPPVVLGFVDLEKVLDAHPRSKQKQDEIGLVYKQRLEELRVRAESLKSQRESLEVIPEGSPEWLTKLETLRMEDAKLGFDKKILAAEIQLLTVGAMKEFYKDAKAAIAEVAQQRGFTAVATVSSGPVDGRSRNEFVADVVTRPFVYHDPSLDLTADVIAQLAKK